MKFSLVFHRFFPYHPMSKQAKFLWSLSSTLLSEIRASLNQVLYFLRSNLGSFISIEVLRWRATNERAHRDFVYQRVRKGDMTARLRSAIKLWDFRRWSACWKFWVVTNMANKHYFLLKQSSSHWSQVCDNSKSAWRKLSASAILKRAVASDPKCCHVIFVGKRK